MTTEYKKAKQRAWEWFSKYIKLKYSKNGLCICITCGSVLPILKIQAGHGIQGRGMAVLFDERIVRPQCIPCNAPPPVGKWGGNYGIYSMWIIDTYGRQMYEKMLSDSRKPVKFSSVDLRHLSNEYRKKYNELKAVT